ncbi:MAG TPA: phosphohistidine phosphatase SixA [Nitrospira sp.]
MDCILVRHGIAVERDEWEGTDADRPLTERGAKRVEQVAAGLKWLDVKPTHIFSSPLVRAVETARILQTTFALRASIRRVEELLPGAEPERLVHLLHDLPDKSCVLFAGHEPHLSAAASVMLTGKSSQAFPFKKGGACLIEMPVPAKPGHGILRWWMGPAELRAVGKKQAKLEAKER